MVVYKSRSCPSVETPGTVVAFLDEVETQKLLRAALKKAGSARCYGVQVYPNENASGLSITVNRCPKFAATASDSDSALQSVAQEQLAALVPEHCGDPGVRQRIIELYDGLRPSLHAYLYSLGMSPDQAEDVIQETFLRLVGYRLQESTEENLRAWVFRVAHNLSMDVHRFQQRWSWTSEDDSHPLVRQKADPGPSPEQRVLLEERWKHLQDAFEQLTPKQRQCILLRAEGFRYREIAHILGISVQRVGELMQRSLTLLEVHT